MKCIPINKNKKIALIELNTQTNTITNIYEIYNINYTPLALKNAVNGKVENNVKTLNNQLKVEITRLEKKY